MTQLNQRTLRTPVSCAGIGLHSGVRVQLTLKPAPAGSGLVFVRTDLTPNVEIPARPEFVVDTAYATSLGIGQVRVGTVEHLLAAFSGLGIDNARVELNGPEVPIMDGSAAPFVYLIRTAGIELQRKFKRFLLVRKTLEVSEGSKSAQISPARQFSIDCTIDFDHPLISDQSLHIDFSDRAFYREICRARTFGFLRDVEQMKRHGLALGGTLENAIVIDDFNILNPDGLRYSDEFVRHKVLDIVGDLALCGMPVIGHVTSVKSGHALNHRLLKRLMNEAGAAEVVEVRERKQLERLDIRPPVWAGLEGHLA
jgi:UDP-3-O-[3-hydroxymyristoyl] N-acetylglucosamine deacetylase